MRFTNENPCRYQYTDCDENFSSNLDLWLEKAVPERILKNEHIFREQHNDNSATNLNHLPVKMTKEQFEKERLLYRYYVTENYDEAGLPIEMSIEEVQQKLLADAGLIAPKAFEFIKESFPNGVSRFGVTYVNKHSSYTAHKHLHPRIMAKDLKMIRECKTCLVVIPIQHTAPATEKLFLNHQEPNDHQVELIMDLCRWTASPYETVRGHVLDVAMPSMGQYLVVNFISSRCLHWVENYGTENNYLCLVAEN